jgi:hypothetical protein
MPAIGRQFVAHDVQRLADAGDIASAEDHQAAEDRQLLAFDLGHLRQLITRQRLRHGEADGFCHGALSKFPNFPVAH